MNRFDSTYLNTSCSSVFFDLLHDVCFYFIILIISCIALGAKVIATAGSQAKLEVCKRFGGADFVVDYTKKGWQNEVLKITGGHGAGMSSPLLRSSFE
jgi:hypothetical protein